MQTAKLKFFAQLPLLSMYEIFFFSTERCQGSGACPFEIQEIMKNAGRLIEKYSPLIFVELPSTTPQPQLGTFVLE